MNINYIDLFSGIGGFALGLQYAGFGFKKHYYSEVDEYAKRLYSKRFPEATGLGDIRRIRGLELEAIDILTGGFPCQPFSVAGQQKGKEDNRYLWTEMFRVIQETKPTWIIGENVTGIIKLALDEVLSNLEGERYACQTLIIPACSVNAPHRRDRIWIIANSNEPKQKFNKRTDKRKKKDIRRDNKGNVSTGPIKYVTDSESRSNRRHKRKIITERKPCGSSISQVKNATNTRSKRQQRQGQQGKQMYSKTNGKEEINRIKYDNKFQRNWIEIAAELCGVDDGLSTELDGFKLSKSRHRIERLKALGNAVVPQIVEQIGKAILEVLD